ncbi:Ribosomal large subunit pseudouridine synthase C [Candidatus Providencia siddallii]|uniref:Pseudouridine synthase n=1 Tax=Candidatus Providencia siddallii TaxID=1715285 RepID=A0A0M6W920_9GAMM|nr:Ribosomal large subunit pseudouridine synthase C [Candidatus Providencia siddallii]
MTNKQNKIRFIYINNDEIGQRIDNFILSRFKGVPSSMIYRIIHKGEIRVNKGRVKPKYKLQIGDIIRIPPIKIYKKQQISSLTIKKFDFLTNSILYEDDSILAINKPSGIAVHGGSGLNFGIIEGLRSIRESTQFLELVHRLDKDTSGVLLIAKKRSVLRILHEQLRLNQIKKNYIALVHGKWKNNNKLIKKPLLKNILQCGKRVVTVSNVGKYSETSFKIKECFENLTLIKATPSTGRTHQIRVHTTYVGHPIVFDVRYGNKQLDKLLIYTKLTRLFLHANSLKFIHPKIGKKIKLYAPLSNELNTCLDILRKRKNTFI